MEKLPNIGPVLAGNLEKIGVTTHEQLCRIGAREAFLRIRAEVDSTACLHQLEALAGAEEGRKKSLLPKQIKEELKVWYKAL